MQIEARDAFVAYDSAFAEVTGPTPRLVNVIDADAHEGPVYVRDEDALYFTSVPVQSEQGSRYEYGRISRVDPRTGCYESIVDQWQGLRFNSPNDVVVKRDGSIWFTDPSYGFLQGFKDTPQVGDYVYRCHPQSRQLTVVADCFDKPNGLAFSPDESILYVGDSGAIHVPGDYSVERPHHVQAFDVRDGGHLTNRRLFAVTTNPTGTAASANGHATPRPRRHKALAGA